MEPQMDNQMEMKNAGIFNMRFLRERKIKYDILFFFMLSHIGAIYGVKLLYDYVMVSGSGYILLDLLIKQQIISMLGITIGAHRLWSHRSFEANIFLRVIMMLCNSICNEGSIYWWCRDHIMHHKYSDTTMDPYNSNEGLFYSHIGWMFVDKHPDLIERSKQHDFSHLLDDPVVRFQYKLDPYFRHFMCFVLPTIYGHYMYEDWKVGLFAFGFLRWLITLHSTWTVNSLAHYSGSRPNNKDIKPTNNLLVSILAVGEGWHNYHHTYPFDYSCAEKDFIKEYNPSTLLIDMFAFFGLVKNRKIPKNKESKIIMDVLKVALPNINYMDDKGYYKFKINDYRALRLWLYESKDILEGFNKLHKNEVIELNGDFNIFMSDFMKSVNENTLSLREKAKLGLYLYNMDKIKLKMN